ncbi:MAG: hypothetical protein GXP06_09120 [Alphaproteobacteria bacterium]|nr:hypothetical protein [Alphaproteobacteria bacterium]
MTDTQHMRYAGFLGAIALFSLWGCESVAELQQISQNLGRNLQRNVVQTDGLRMEMKWCGVAADRTVECEFQITSLYKDVKAGLVYPKMQDQQGNEIRLKRKDGIVGAQTIVAGQPYTRRFIASNLPTYSTHVRSVVTGIVIKDLRGIKIGERPIVFGNIPEKPVAAIAPPPVPETDDTAIVSTPTTQTPTPAPPEATPVAVNTVVNSYWHGIIVPVVEMPGNQLTQLWARGAYIHLREDGIAGYNWSTPNVYVYDNANTWKVDGDTFTVSMSGASYTFDAQSQQTPLTTFINEGGLFKMTMARKGPKEN